MQHLRILSSAIAVSLLAFFAAANEVDTPQKWPAGAPKTTAAGRFTMAANGATGCTIGPLSPPDTNDQRYVADCSSTFDAIVHNTDPSPQATIRVSRVAGDVDKLRANHLIGSKATIMISAFDVNTGDFARVPRGAAQEHDKVFFNDHELGILVGAGGQWRITTFEVPVEWVNFARDNSGGPPVPADNVIRIQVDADNHVPVWSTEIDWVSLEFQVVRPIILAHGGFATPGTWSPFWTGQLDALGVPHDEVRFPEDGRRTIEENAAVFSTFLDDHLRRWGVDKVNIEAHSKGGLDSRHMVENRTGVDRVAMVGTPNCGMKIFDIATVLSHLGPLIPVGIVIDIKAPLIPELTTPSMKIYNHYHGHNPNVRYSTLAGGYHAHTLSPYKALQAVVGFGDLIVSQSSAQCLSWSFNTKYESFGNNHNAMHWNEVKAQPAFDSLWNLVRTVPSGAPLKPAAMSARTVAANDFDEDAEYVFTASTPATVQQGETKSFSMPIDDAHPAAFAIFYSGTAIGAELISPTGVHYTWNQVWDENSGISNGDDEIPTTQGRIKSYTFDAPEVGVWTLNVTGVDAGTSNFGVTGLLQTPSTAMVASIETEAVHLGTPLRVRATVTRGGAPLTGATATALVTRPDDSQQQITLHDDGASGVYVGDVATPIAGAYDIVVTAEDHRPGQPAFSRQSIVRGTVSASLTRFEGPYSDSAFDTDGDHGLDTLLVNGFLNVVEPGTYRLFGVLTDMAGNEVTTAPFSVTMPFGGTLRFSLPFPGAGIYASSINGPYKLTLRLAEERGGAILPIQEEAGVYTTGNYFYYQFGAPPPPDKFPTTVTVDAASGPYQGPATLVAHLKDNDGNPLANRFLTFQVGFSTAGFAVTDATGTATLTDAFLSSLNFLGGYRLDAFFAGDPKYSGSSGQSTFFMGLGTQTIAWTPPAQVPPGTILSPDNILNATVTGSGNADPAALVYEPGEGTMLQAGTQVIKVTAPATDVYAEATKSVTIIVGNPQATVSWNNPADIVYGTALGAAQLNATADTTGTFTYNPPAGAILDAGTQQLHVTFTPSTPGMTGTTKTVVVNVSKANQTIAWSDPAPIVYGTPLSATQLNATVNGPGALTYAPPAGTLLGAGSHTLTATAAATANANAATASVTLQVQKATPVVTWSAPASIVYGTPLSATQLNASANVPGTFTYSPAAGTVLGAGNAQTLSVAFAPADAANYSAASATTTIDVAKAEQTIQWPAPADIVYGTPLSSAQLNATVTGPGALTYAPPAGTILDAGSHQLTVTAAATPNFNAATASVTLLVKKGTPSLTWSTPAAIVYGTPLSSTQLNATANVPGSFAYMPAAGTILDAGNARPLHAVFTPADAANYETAEAAATIDVAKAKQSIAWTAPAAIVYGTPLGAAQLNATVSVVGPTAAGALTYVPTAGTVLDAGGAQTLSVTAAETANYEAASAHVTIDVARAPLSLRADNKSKVYGDAVPPLTGTLAGVVNHDAIGAAYATAATVSSPVGTYAITASLTDPNGRLRNYDVTIANATLSVTKALLSITANDASKQYSDVVPALTAAFGGFVLGETPAVLGGTLSITTTATKTSAPGTYPIAIGGLGSPNYAIVFTGGTLTVTQEDARAVFTAPLAMSTPSAASGTATVTLSSTVLDISAAADANGDADSGDIRNATLTFVDRVSGETLCTAPLALISAGDARIAAGSCSFTGTIRAYQVGTRIGGYYVRDAAADDVTVTVAAPTENFITGSGSLVSTQSAGAKAAANGTAQTFTFDLKYDKSGPVKGSLRLTFSRTESDARMHVYAIDADPATTSLSFAHTTEHGIAYATGSATLTDVTDARQPVVVAAAAPMLLTMTDDSPAKTQPTLSLVLFNPAGGLWFSSSWNGTRTAEQPLATGTVQIHWK